MPRLGLLLVVLAACSAPAKPVVPPQPAPPDARPPTAAELALEAHRDRLLDQHGVVNVRVGGDGLIVDVCAPEVPVDLTGIDVPVSPLAGDWPSTARDEPCGCVEAETYFDDGAAFPRACNACTCAGGEVTCTALLCELQERIRFWRNAALLDDHARTVLDAAAQALIAHPDVKVVIRGHADANEISIAKLSKKRARAVKDYLLAAKVPAAQLGAIEAVGADQPLGQGAEADRNVELVLAD